MSSLFRALTTTPTKLDEKPYEGKPATRQIKKQQREILRSLPFNQKDDFERALQGRKARLEPNVLKNDKGQTIWDNDSYSFLNPESSNVDGPDTANPSLWRQSKLCAIDGLFEVSKGIYQVRGLDLANISIVEGKEGIIVLDTLTGFETAEAALKLYQKHYGPKDVKAVIYTHSHGDHFGGVKAFLTQDDLDKGAKLIAPEGFLEHAVSENVYVGTAMARRAGYMYGAALPRGPTGGIGAGLGQTLSGSAVTLLKPTDIITKTGQTMTVDGVEMIFQMAPNTEAPAEMLIFFPQLGALCAAEDAVHTLHNVLTLRGAVVRDPHQWARVLTETIDMFGGRANVIFASHHWPTWGYDKVIEFLTLQRDLYAYLHDQTLRLINKGYTAPEIGEMIKLPPALDQAWSCRGYYGTVNHNVKAIYQRYIGWWDGNPAHYWEHIPTERAKRYVSLAGGMGNLLKEGQTAFENGDFRWAAELLNHAVFADPDNSTAKGLLADTYEQIGYGSESGPWRDFFLSGTLELRTGNFGTPTTSASADVLSSLSPEMLMDSFAIQINGPKAFKEKFSIKIVLTDGPRYLWWLSNAALVYKKAGEEAVADITLTASTKNLTALAKGLEPKALNDAGIYITGDVGVLKRLGALLDPGDPSFNIVTP